MVEPEYKPTHRIYLNKGGTVDVMLVDRAGPAYTREEWETTSQADYEKTIDGWRFQGGPVFGRVEKVY